jgi:hypothetical protein
MKGIAAESKIKGHTWPDEIESKGSYLARWSQMIVRRGDGSRGVGDREKE